jgi:stringent starvation protein B
MGNEWVEFSARFSGKSHKIEVPVANVLAIYARENGQGMAFPVDSAGGEATDSGADAVEADELPPVKPAGSGPRAVESEPAPAPQAKADETDPDGTPGPDDDGSKGGGRGHLKVVK